MGKGSPFLTLDAAPPELMGTGMGVTSAAFWQRYRGVSESWGARMVSPSPHPAVFVGLGWALLVLIAQSPLINGRN